MCTRKETRYTKEEDIMASELFHCLILLHHDDLWRNRNGLHIDTEGPQYAEDKLMSCLGV
jgi:hypothetical protein